MITFDNVSLWTPNTHRESPILLDCTIQIAPRARVGILAPAGSGKSSIARLFCGIDRPDRGCIQIKGRPSWPIGFAGFLHPELRVAQNIATIAELCGFPAKTALDFIADFVEIPNVLGRKTENLSPSERALVAYAISVVIPSDYLIADEVITVGNPVIRQKCEAYLETVLRDAGLVFMSRSRRQLRQYCETYFILIDHKLKPCSDLDAGQDALDMAANRAKELELSDV